MHILTRGFRGAFFAFFLLPLSVFSSDTQYLEHTNIPDDIADAITARIAQLPPVYKDERLIIRHGTPQNYTNAWPELEANKAPNASLADRLFYSLETNHMLPSCLLALLGTSHPNAWKTEDPESQTRHPYPERAYAVFTRSVQGREETHIGFIHTAPGLKGEAVTGCTLLAYTLFHKYRYKGYAAPMIKGFKAYLESLQGPALTQFTLPNTKGCEAAMRQILAQGDSNKSLCLSGLGITSTCVPFVEIRAHVSLENQASFIATYRAGFHPLEIRQIWASKNPILEDIVTESDIPTGEDSHDFQQRLNKFFVLSNRELKDLEKDLDAHLKAYVEAGRDGRQGAFPVLAKVIMAQPVTGILFPD